MVGSTREFLSLTANPRSPSYRMRFTDSAGARGATSLAVIGGLEIVDLEAGGVLPHERDHTRGVHRSPRSDPRDRGQPVSGLGLSLSSGLTELLAEPGEALGAAHTTRALSMSWNA